MPMSPQQLEAVNHIDGPCCVTAGAGAGKTTVLTKRIENLVKHGVDPKSILSITFTKKAAEEMKERLVKLIGEPGKDVFMGTFHSFGLRVLGYRAWKQARDRKQEESARPNILGADEQLAIFSDLVSQDSVIMKKPVKNEFDPMVAAGFVSWQKNNLLFPEDELDFSQLEKECDGDELSDAEKSDLRKIYRSYENYKRKKNIIDFDDMLTETYLALKNDSEIRNHYINKYRYILVDEFQDTNVAQYEIVKLVAGYNRNVLIVGDARQAIYSWRCSNVQFILDFPKEWPGTHVVSLDDNYRSTIEVVDLSTKLIEHATIKYPGHCRSGLQKHGDPVYSVVTDTDQDEADLVAQIIYDFVKKQHRVRWQDIAILYRTNAQSILFENACIALDIPYAVAGASDFYDLPIIKEIMSYLHFVEKPDDINRFRELLKLPEREVDEKAPSFLADVIRENPDISVLDAIYGSWSDDDIDKGNKDAKELLYFADVISAAQAENADDDTNVCDLIKNLCKRMGYYKFVIERQKAKQKADDSSAASLIDTFANSCKRFNHIKELFDYIQRAKDQQSDKDVSKVQMMTLHRSKGLEYKMVFVVGMNEGILPHKNSIEYDKNDEIIPESIEEERRLCYVGITRAKEILFLTSRSDKEASPFFKELELYTENIDDYYQAVKEEWRKSK